jgi:hypothetical protein
MEPRSDAPSPAPTPVHAVADAVSAYREHANISVLHEQLAAIPGDADALAAAAESYRDIPEVAGPLYERVIAEQPNNARALVSLASAYWLHGRGPDVVGGLAARAMAADPTNRGAWHLWALTEGSPRARVTRWEQVSRRFPEDDLARANLADNAASLASAEHDPVALGLALDTYRALRARAATDEQRAALDAAITTLSGWRW